MIALYADSLEYFSAFGRLYFHLRASARRGRSLFSADIYPNPRQGQWLEPSLLDRATSSALLFLRGPEVLSSESVGLLTKIYMIHIYMIHIYDSYIYIGIGICMGMCIHR